MERRDMQMMYDGRNPYGSEGGYVVSSRGRGRGRGRGRRGDRGMMDYGYDGRTIPSYPTIHPQGDYADMNYDMARGGGRGRRGRGGRRDYAEYDMARGQDMRPMDYRGGNYRGSQMSDRADMRMGDGHHYPEQMGGQTYYPIEAMGRFNGYWGMPQGDYGYPDMRGRRDYGYDYGDYGETLSEEELDDWCKKLKGQLDEREKQMFSEEMISQKAKQMGKQMQGFGEKELEVTTLMVYTDYKQTIGQNVDLAIKLAFDWLTDKDVAVKGAEKLAVYYDDIVMGGDD